MGGLEILVQSDYQWIWYSFQLFFSQKSPLVTVWEEGGGGSGPRTGSGFGPGSIHRAEASYNNVIA